MAKQNLEARCKKAILNIENKVSRIYDILKDIGMKLCHIIEYKFNNYPLNNLKYDGYN